MQLQINGTAVEAQADPNMPLLWVLRDVLNMTAPNMAAVWLPVVHAPRQPASNRKTSLCTCRC